MEKSKLVIMGILNVTPDSFSDGGEFLDVDRAVARAEEMISQGAKIIDVGGESSGPGSVDVSLKEEIGRVIPVIDGLSSKIGRPPFFGKEDILISVDTYKAEVARRAIGMGAGMVNDVTALRGDDQMAAVVADTGVQIVLMYSKDNSARTTGEVKEYDDVVQTIKAFLKERISFAESKGIKREKIIVDPGMGAFVSGDPQYSWEILERLREFEELGCPILIGASRKSFLGGMVGDRLESGLKAARMAMENGASVLRVHDVTETKRALNRFL